MKDNINLYTYVANSPMMYTDRMGLKGKPIGVWSNAKDYTSNLIGSGDSSLILFGYFLRLHMEVIEGTPYILDSLFLVEQAHPGQLSYTDELESYYQEKSNIEKGDLASGFLLISYMGAKGANLSNNFIYLNDTSTWPKPPCKGSCTEGLPSRLKPAQRGEKSLYDEAGGEWRISPENRSPGHQELHWDYKASPKSKWENIDINGNIL